MKRKNHPAEEAGYKAFFAGKRLTANPYTKKLEAYRHKLWIKGWKWAQTLKIGLTENMDGSPGV